MLWRATIAAVAIVALLSLPATAHPGHPKKIGEGTGFGDFAIALAGGHAKKPKSLSLKVTATPDQQIAGAYTVVCVKGIAAKTSGGSFEGVTPYTLKLPKPIGKPDSCDVSADAQLSGSGSMKSRYP